MKLEILLSFITVAFMISCQDNNYESPDLQKLNIKDNISSFEEISFKAEKKFGEISKGKKEGIYGGSHYTIDFDEDGNRIETNWYEKDGQLDGKEKYVHFENGFEKEASFYIEDGSLYSKIIYQYTDDDKIIEANTYNNDGTLDQKELYKYSDSKYPDERVVYNSSGAIETYYKYNYDEEGNRIKSDSYDSTGELTYSWKNKFDNQRNIDEDYMFEGESDLIEFKRYEYKYDEYNNWVQKIIYIDDIPEYIVIRKYTYR